MVELVRVLEQAQVELPGALLFSSHDLHEKPVGLGEGLRSLIEQGYVGDAAIVIEGISEAVLTAGKSNCIAEIDLRFKGEAMHELSVPPDTANLAEVGAEVVLALKALRERVSQRRDDLVGPESLFLGITQAGDFYNRLPTSCRIVLTRRYPPDVKHSDVERELYETVKSVTEGLPIEVTVDTSKRNDGFSISPDEPLVQTIQAAYRDVTGNDLPTGVQLFGADNAKFINWGKVPAVGHGIGLDRNHADVEWCDINDVARVVQVLLMTTLKFYGLA
jgi:acetylornithine deacetylase/succinyl-diaminopimelate desuccinylase-like protein